MRLSVLGVLDLRIGGGSVGPAGQRPRRILAALAAQANRPVPLDQLVDFVWAGRPPASAANSLQSHISRLRRSLGDRIESTAGGYRLRADAQFLDVIDFERLVELAASRRAAGDRRGAVAALDDALTLCDGAPFAGLADQDPVRMRALEVEGLRRRALRDWAELCLDLGDHLDALPRLEGAISQEPWDERLHQLWAVALFRAGRQTEALGGLARLRSRMRTELGLEPGHDVRALEERILRNDELLLTPSSSPGAAEPFFGRAAELALLRDALARARAGTGSVVLVAGDPGIGKTRLAEQVEEFAGPQFDVVWGRGFDERPTRRYAPWAQVFDAWLGLGGGHEVAALGAGAEALLPALDLRDPPNREVAGPEPPMARLVADACHAAARLRPLVVLLDDLHWADRETIEALEHLGRDIAASPLIVVGLFRETEVPTDGPLRQVTVELARRRSTLRIDLDGLDRPAVAQLVAERLPGEVPDWVTDRLLRETGGNPFYLSETVDVLAERGDPAGLRPDAPWPLAGGIRDLTWQRVARLPEQTWELLAVAAVAGTQIDLTQLAAATGSTTHAVLAGLEPALRAGLLRREGSGVPQLWFEHALVRDAVAESLSEIERSTWHRRLGFALAPQVVPADPEQARRAARHLAEAAPLDAEAATLAIDILESLARAAGARGDPVDAAGQLSRALALSSAAHLPATRQAALRLARADHRRRSGDLSDASADYRTAAEMASGREPLILARAALGFEDCSLHGRRHRDGVRDPSVVLLEEALAQLPATEPALRIELLAASAQALGFAGVASRAREVSAAAVRAAAESGETRAVARAQLVAASLLDQAAEATDRAETLIRALGAAERAGDPGLEVEARRLLVPDLMRLGRLAEVHRQVDAVERAAEVAGSDLYRWNVPMWRAALALGTGRLDEAGVLIDRFRAAGEHHGYADVGRVHGMQRMLLLLARGRPAEARAALLDAADDDFEPWDYSRVAVDVAAGEVDAARRGFLELSARRFRLSVPYAGMQAFVAGLLAEPCLQVGDDEAARLLLEMLEPACGRNLVLGAGAAMLGDAALAMGQLAGRIGQWDRAERLLRAAAHNNAAWGLVPAAARARELLVAGTGRCAPEQAERDDG